MIKNEAEIKMVNLTKNVSVREIWPSYPLNLNINLQMKIKLQLNRDNYISILVDSKLRFQI